MKLRLRLAILLLVSVCLKPATVLAQDMKQADKYFNNFEFSLALEAYKKILDSGEPSIAVVQRIADSYRILNNSKEAEFWYAQVVNFPNADPTNIYLYAESAKRNGNYAKAKLLFQEYGRKVPAQAVIAERMAASCDTALQWMASPQAFEVQKSKALNSEGADFSPVKTKEGLFFASDRLESKQTMRNTWTGNGYIQMYFAKAINDSTWSTPEPLPSSINTTYHNGPAAYLEKNQTLYFTRTQVVKRNASKSNPDPTSWFKGAENSTHTNRHGIYIAERKGEKWDNVKAFKYNNTDEFSIGHPAITTDGKVLYFVSDMPGGLGETDVYFSELQSDGSWSKPVNAGNIINTPGRESFTSIGEDGNLYFSSDGHIGMGGLDIFKAVGTHKNWNRVENLKYPLNTSHDDFGIQVNASGKTGLLSSGRLASNGFDDIFTFKESWLPCTVTGKTIEYVTERVNRGKKKELAVSKVLLQITEVGNENKPIEVRSDADGNFTVPVRAGGQYIIKGSKPNYLTQTLSISPDCRFVTDSVKVEMVFNRDTPNKPIVLENIYYDLDKHEIKPEAARELDKLVQTLKDNPGIRIELSSHTDSRQSHRYNEMLSQLRAQSAVEYIISKGIDRDRLVAKGYGETQLVNKCKDGVTCPETMHAENRRTEFKIIGNTAQAR